MLLITQDKIIYYNLEENKLFLKINENNELDVYTDKNWGLDVVTGDYIISYCTYISETDNEDYVVYTEDIIQYKNLYGEVKVGKVKFINNEFVVVDKNDNIVETIRNNKETFITEVYILNKDSAFGEYIE